MQKLLINIFLSSLIACGAKNKSGPSEILILGSNDSGNRVSSLFIPKLEILYMKDMNRSLDVKKINGDSLFEKHFFTHYKGQFDKQSVKVPHFKMKGRQFFKVKGSSKFLAKIKVKDFKALNTLTIRFYNFDAPEESLPLHLGNYELEREIIELEFETATFSNVTTLAMEIVDFNYKKKNKAINHLQELDNFKRNHYRLSVTSSTKTLQAYVPTDLSLTQALSKMKINHRTNSFAKITQLLGVSGSNKKMSLWNFPDAAGIWEVVNTPSQSLNYRPLGGENILIKWVSVRDILTKVYRRETENIRLDSPEIKIDWKGAIRVEITDLKIDRLLPYQTAQEVGANQVYFKVISTRERDRKEKKNGRCTVKKHFVGWKRTSINDPHLKIASGVHEMTATKVVLKKKSSIFFKLKTKRKSIAHGYTNKTCKRGAKLNYALGTKTKSVSEKLEGIATITRIYND